MFSNIVEVQDSEYVEPEIRINKRYSTIYNAIYDDRKLEKDSKPIIKRQNMITDDLLSHLFQVSDKPTIVPPNCRYLEETDRGSFVVIEEPPQLRTIKIFHDIDLEYSRLSREGKIEKYGLTVNRQTPRNFTLAFPYVIFILSFNNDFSLRVGEVYFRTRQLLGQADKLFKAPLLNISTDQSICFGSGIHDVVFCQSLTAAVQQTIMLFWANTFNPDYTYNYTDYENVPMVNTYVEWEHLSKTNPMFIYNVEWKQFPITIGQTILRMKERFIDGQRKITGFNKFSKIFHKPKKSEKTVDVGDRVSKRHRQVYFDIASQYIFEDNFEVNLGDHLKINNKKHFIYSFAGIDMYTITHFQLVNEDNKKVLLKNTTKTRDFLRKGIEKERFIKEATLPNGLVIRKGDILILPEIRNRKYLLVDYIRESIEGNIEVKLGQDFFLINELHYKIEKFNIKNPVINGKEISIGKEYILTNTLRKDRITNVAKKITVKKFSVKMGQIALEYLRDLNNNQTIRTPLSSVQDFIEIDNVITKQTPIRIGRTLYDTEKGYVELIDGYVLNDQNNRLTYKYNIKNIKKLLNKDTLHIPGTHLDITFKIGDNVVVANWTNPLDVLSVKTITDFVIEEEKNLYFKLTDKEGNISYELYINSEEYTQEIYTGRIRKVVGNIDDLKAGTKIKANEGYIPAFPKKDVNIIVAFLIDTGTEPLVLCSNGCTLWYSDVINKFTRIEMGTPTWDKLNHTPLDITKIKFQPGDIIEGTSFPYDDKCGYICYLYGLRSTTIYIERLDRYRNKYPDCILLNKSNVNGFIFDCIPEPRIAISKIKEFETTYAHSTLHSSYVRDRTSNFIHLNTGKGVLDNVSCLHQ